MVRGYSAFEIPTLVIAMNVCTQQIRRQPCRSISTRFYGRGRSQSRDEYYQPNQSFNKKLRQGPSLFFVTNTSTPLEEQSYLVAEETFCFNCTRMNQMAKNWCAPRQQQQRFKGPQRRG